MEYAMKKILAAVLAMAAPHAADAFGISTGNDLVQLGFHVERRINDGLSQNPSADRELLGHLNGFVIGSILMLAHTDPRVCMPKDGTLQQHKAVIRGYLESNPALLGRHASVLVREAMVQAFPCKDKS
jgi:hypothetical protein